MSLYLDSSCFLKLFFPEPESDCVRAVLEEENRVVISTITEVETLTQIYGFHLGRHYTKQKLTRLLKRLSESRNMDPFEFVQVDQSLFNTAKKQISARRGHCRTMDRLHLAAMQDFRMSRLFTNDRTQAQAARDLGFHVIHPN